MFRQVGYWSRVGMPLLLEAAREALCGRRRRSMSQRGATDEEVRAAVLVAERRDTLVATEALDVLDGPD